MRAFAALLVVSIGAAGCSINKGTIGAVLAQDENGHLFVREVPEGLAADRGGLEVGDEILTIDGQDARAMGPRGVHEALSGKVGESVKLTLIRRGQVVRVTLARTRPQKHPIRETP